MRADPVRVAGNESIKMGMPVRVQGAFLCKSRGGSALVTPKRTFAACKIPHPGEKIFSRFVFDKPMEARPTHVARAVEA